MSAKIKKILAYLTVVLLLGGLFAFSEARQPISISKKEYTIEDTLAKLSEKARLEMPRIEDENTYTYPYSDAPQQLLMTGEETITIFSYGSLMNKESASRTLSAETLDTFKPALAFGAQRIFDRDWPVSPDSKWQVPCDAKSRGMLNLKVTQKSEHIVNGVVYELPIEDLMHVLDREHGYDLVPILVTDWNTKDHTSPKFYVAFTFHAPQTSMYTNPEIYPRPLYYEMTRDAAKSFGPDFYNLFLNSTSTADGKSIKLWEKKIEQKHTATLTNRDNCGL